MTPPQHHDDEDRPPTELTTDEIQWIREQRKQSEHERWLRGQVKVIWPWVVAVVTAVVVFVNWVKDHVKL